MFAFCSPILVPMGRLIHFTLPKPITQKELQTAAALEDRLDRILGDLYQRWLAGARLEPGPMALRMRHRPERAISSMPREKAG